MVDRSKLFQNLAARQTRFDEEPSEAPEPNQVPLATIKPNPNQPRRYFDPEALANLQTSIREHGILEPLLVRPQNKGYELVAGERRYQAAKALGLKMVPVIIRELSNSEALKIALTENLQREDLNPVEETQSILDLLALELATDIDDVRSRLNKMKHAHDRTHDLATIEGAGQIDQLLTGLGYQWRSWVKNRLPVLNLPPIILEALAQGQLKYTAAIAIARVNDETAMQTLLDQAIAGSLSVAQIRDRVRALNAQPQDEFKVRCDRVFKKLRRAEANLNTKQQKKLANLLAQLDQLLDGA
jgi:ParB family chromosome partitioning protein